LEQEVWGARAVNSIHNDSRALKRPLDTLPAQNPRLPEPRSVNSSPSLEAPPGGTNLGVVPDSQPQYANTADSRDARSGSRLHLGAPRRTDASVSYGQGVNGRNRLRLGKSSATDDLGAQGERGKLIVQSSVRGARITINGRDDPKWVTPHMFTLVAGTYIVSVSMEGYSAWTQRVHVDVGRHEWLQAQLTSNETGVFAVVTEPPGMPVYIDGRSYGVSRVVTELPAGWHTCEVVPPAGIKPLVGRFHLDPGEALTKRIRVKTSDASAVPITQAQRAGTLQ